MLFFNKLLIPQNIDKCGDITLSGRSHMTEYILNDCIYMKFKNTLNSVKDVRSKSHFGCSMD